MIILILAIILLWAFIDALALHIKVKKLERKK